MFCPGCHSPSLFYSWCQLDTIFDQSKMIRIPNWTKNICIWNIYYLQWKDRERQKKNYDRKVKHVKIEVGDKVLVKRLAFDGKHKIQDKFEEEVYTVTEQPRQDIPFFTVRAPSGSERTLHRPPWLGESSGTGESGQKIQTVSTLSKGSSLENCICVRN